jgi:hypothetical protein
MEKGGGNNRESDSYRKMRDIKKCLRSEQRKLEAQKRNNRMTEMMELSETNDKKFYCSLSFSIRFPLGL